MDTTRRYYPDKPAGRIMTIAEFAEYAENLANSMGFTKIKWNANKIGITFSFDLDVEVFIEKYFPNMSFTTKKKVYQYGSYASNGAEYNIPNKGQVDFWLRKPDPELISLNRQLREQLENNYMYICQTLFTKLKNSELWITL